MDTQRGDRPGCSVAAARRTNREAYKKAVKSDIKDVEKKRGDNFPPAHNSSVRARAKKNVRDFRKIIKNDKKGGGGAWTKVWKQASGDTLLSQIIRAPIRELLAQVKYKVALIE